MIRFEHATAALVNPLLESWGHYLGDSTGPRLVLWYALYLRGVPISVAVSASPWKLTFMGSFIFKIGRLAFARKYTTPDLRCWDRVLWRFWWLSRPDGWKLPYGWWDGRE